MSNPPVVDYTKLTPKQLRDLRQRYEDKGHPELAQRCADELASRGAATMSDYSHLRWNQLTVREALRPFEKLARFDGNRRTAYTEAGGGKIGYRKTDPEWYWVDSYSGMSSGSENWIFVCQIKRPGDDPVFTLRDHGAATSTYNADDLEDALERWSELATRTRNSI